jgi:hypothetical protein
MDSAHLRHTLRSILALSLLIGPTLAQAENPPVYPGKIGFSISGVQGSVGDVCSGFTCQPYSLGLTRGETLTATIRSNLQARWILLAGVQPSPCLTLPGFYNGWAGPSIPVAVGALSLPDTIRCWGAKGSLAIPVPLSQPLKASVTLQLVADNSAGTSFSSPMVLTVTL